MTFRLPKDTLEANDMWRCMCKLNTTLPHGVQEIKELTTMVNILGKISDSTLWIIFELINRSHLESSILKYIQARNISFTEKQTQIVANREAAINDCKELQIVSEYGHGGIPLSHVQRHAIPRKVMERISSITGGKCWIDVNCNEPFDFLKCRNEYNGKTVLVYDDVNGEIQGYILLPGLPTRTHLNIESVIVKLLDSKWTYSQDVMLAASALLGENINAICTYLNEANIAQKWFYSPYWTNMPYGWCWAGISNNKQSHFTSKNYSVIVLGML